MSTPTDRESRTRELKDKAIHEAREFFRIFTYLWVMLSLFALYASLLQAHTDTCYIAFSFALLEAFIGAKVILVGQGWSIIRKYEDRPLIYPTLYKSFAFLLLMVGASVIEKCVDCLIHHKPILTTLTSGTHIPVLLAGDLMIVLSLIPFLAIREIARVERRNLIYRLFIHPGPQPAKTGAEEADSLPAGC